MKTAIIVFLGVMLALVSVLATWHYLHAQAATNVLDAIYKIHPGTTQDEVRTIMKDQRPTVVRADEPHDWLVPGAPTQTEGEFWHFYMGHPPPRILVIYFDKDGKVVFTTWAPT